MFTRAFLRRNIALSDKKLGDLHQSELRLIPEFSPLKNLFNVMEYFFLGL